MSSLSPKDRVSLCIFTYADGRRCRTPRTPSHPHLCSYHAQKEARAATADKLAKDLACFFSGHYISANDLSTALARLIPAVVRGDIKPRTARTVAYLAQTLLQSIHHSESEFKNSFGQDNWRKVIRTGITSNHDRLFPPQPNATPAPTPSPIPAVTPIAPQHPPASPHSVSHPAPPPVCHPARPETDRRERSEGSLPTAPARTKAEPRPTPQTQHVPLNLQSATQTTPLTAPPPANQQRRPASPHRDPYAIQFDHNDRLREPEKTF